MSEGVLIEALQRSTSVQTEGLSRLEMVENQMKELEEVFEDRMGRLENEMGTMNAHLDNIARESAITNDFLRMQEERAAAARLREQKLEDDKRKHEREDKKANRDLVVKTGSELWSIFKQPLACLVAAGLAYAAYVWFGLSAPQIPQSSEATPVEESVPSHLENSEAP